MTQRKHIPSCTAEFRPHEAACLLGQTTRFFERDILCASPDPSHAGAREQYCVAPVALRHLPAWSATPASPTTYGQG